MTFTFPEALDLFFRFGALGQLMLVLSLCLRRPLTARAFSLIPVVVCLAAYLLLTAPIPDADYGILRGWLLALTDSMAYVIWFATLSFFRDSFAPRQWPWPVWLAVGLFSVWHMYFFVVLEGRGLFHDFSHLLAIVILAQLIYQVLADREDDLLDLRRDSRLVVALAISSYGILLALVELADESLRHHWLYNLINSGLVCLAITLLLRQFFPQVRSAASDIDSAPETFPLDARPTDNLVSALPAQKRALERKLHEFMEAGGYREPDLTISVLARRLSCPEHQLRQLINKNLNFTNFTAFLNHYRLREACQLLADESQARLPILTLALNLGYGSIGPFNRAFKAAVGQTPSEYRREFQNRL